MHKHIETPIPGCMFKVNMLGISQQMVVVKKHNWGHALHILDIKADNIWWKFELPQVWLIHKLRHGTKLAYHLVQYTKGIPCTRSVDVWIQQAFLSFPLHYQHNIHVSISALLFTVMVTLTFAGIQGRAVLDDCCTWDNTLWTTNVIRKHTEARLCNKLLQTKLSEIEVHLRHGEIRDKFLED